MRRPPSDPYVMFFAALKVYDSSERNGRGQTQHSHNLVLGFGVL